jgi:MoaA/NifB/PqqE/SkfB family radical SAM enzyme
MTTEDSALANLHDVPEIFRFCRKNNIIFDCDSILKRGRGTTCLLRTGDEEYRNTLIKLQTIDREEFGNDWPITPSYVGGPVCDRYHHHLYITQYGEIHPCIGATGVILGNVRMITLKDAWDSPAMRLVRNRMLGGKCGNECSNFTEGKCNSCLGRNTTNMTNEFIETHGYIETVGCWNFKQKG